MANIDVEVGVYCAECNTDLTKSSKQLKDADIEVSPCTVCIGKVENEFKDDISAKDLKIEELENKIIFLSGRIAGLLDKIKTLEENISWYEKAQCIYL